MSFGVQYLKVTASQATGIPEGWYFRDDFYGYYRFAEVDASCNLTWGNCYLSLTGSGSHDIEWRFSQRCVHN